MQRTEIKTTLHSFQEKTGLAYWLAQPVQARIDAVEVLRIQHHLGQWTPEMPMLRIGRVVSLHQFNQPRQF